MKEPRIYCSNCGCRITGPYTVDLNELLCEECSKEDLKYLLEEKWDEVWEEVAQLLNVRVLEVWNG